LTNQEVFYLLNIYGIMTWMIHCTLLLLKLQYVAQPPSLVQHEKKIWRARSDPAHARLTAVAMPVQETYVQ